MNETPNFDTLPGMVYGLKQQVSELTTKFDTFINSVHNPTGQPLPDEQRIYGDKALAEYLNCTVQTVSRLKMAGNIPFHRYGRKYYYLRSEIDLGFKGRVK